MGTVNEEEKVVVAWGYRVQRKVDATACCRYWREREKKNETKGARDRGRGRTIASDQDQSVHTHSCEFEVKVIDTVQETLHPCDGIGLPVGPLIALAGGSDYEI